MSKPSSRQVLGLSVLSTLGLYSLLAASPASAFVLNGGNVTVSADDANRSFDIFFDGSINEKSVSGLSSKATFTFLGFSSVGKNTEAAFKILLSNTSSNGISSRSSALGFDVNQTLLGVGHSDNAGSTRVSGLFSNDGEGAFPNQFGDLDVCFTNGNTCQGGQNGGVYTGSSDSFLPILAFSGNVNTFTLSNFGVRYQSINGNGFNDDSGTGHGSSPPPVVVAPTPTPASPIVVAPTPTPPVVVAPTPVPPVAVAPTPAPPIVVEPTPAPPVVVEPTPAPPVAVAPTPVPPVVVEPTPALPVLPVVVEPTPALPVPPVMVEPTPVPPVAVEPASDSTPQSVPEPGTVGGLVMAGLALLRQRRTR
nr:cistern family PEP-CTERM protein [Leptolyngbya sp. FACHB-541]